MLDSAERQKLIDFADQYLGPYQIKQSGTDEKLIPDFCPFCNGGSHGKDKHTFCLFLNNGTFVCKRGSCGRHGRFEELAKELGGSPISIRRGAAAYEKKSDKQFLLPRFKANAPTEEIYKYFESRKISRATVDAMNVGADDVGNIVFQFFWNGEDIYHKYRLPRKPREDEKKKKEWQDSGTKAILFNMDNVVFDQPLIITEGECFNGDAEIMTPNGWIRLEDYAGQDVLQVDQNMNGSFVKPYAFINKHYAGDMADISIGGNYFSSTTVGHNLVAVQRNNGTVRKFKANEHIPESYNIPTVINFNSSGLALSKAEMALMLAISADGTIDLRKNTGYKKAKEKHYARFAFAKQRKAERICMWLDQAGIEYSNNPIEQNGKEYRSICFSCPENIAYKYLPWDLVTKTTVEQKKFIIEELVHWDGNSVNNRNQYEYCSIIKHNAEVVQAIAHTCGYMSTIIHRMIGGNEGFPVQHMYKVSILLNKRYVSTQQLDKNRSYRHVEQSVYCVSVPTGMILVRQNECISVSGNCDAMALHEAGLTNVVSVPCGCDNNDWITYCFDWLEKFKTIILFGDNDAPGRKAVANWTQKLGDYRILVVKSYPAIPDTDPVEYCKDANEVLYRFGESTLIEMVDTAEEIKTKGIIRVADVVPIDPTKIPRIRTNIPALDDALGGLAEGCVTVFTGKAGNGKSTLSGLILLNAIEQGYTCMAYSGELSAGLFQEWILAQAAGSEWLGLKFDKIRGRNIPFIDPEVQKRILDWLGDRLLLYDNDEQFIGTDTKQADLIISVFEQAARKYDAKLFLIDNMMTSVADSDDEWRAQAMFINKIKKFAKKYMAHVMLVAHPRKTKAGAEITNDDISGTANIMNLCDNAIVIKRPDLEVLKNRIDGKKVSISCCYCCDSRRIYQADKGDLNKFSWNKDGLKKPKVRADSLPEYGVQLSTPVASPPPF